MSAFERLETFQIAAHYLAGQDPVTGRQYHVQITAIHSPHPKEDARDAARESPGYPAAEAQLRHSNKHVVFGSLPSFVSMNQPTSKPLTIPI